MRVFLSAGHSQLPDSIKEDFVKFTDSALPYCVGLLRSTEWKREVGALRAHFLLTLVVSLNVFTDGHAKNSEEA